MTNGIQQEAIDDQWPKWVDKEMRLEPDTTCADCGHIDHCKRMYGVKAENTWCDFHPVRFIPSFSSAIQQRGG